MASREELYERYDDALFQYLMDSVIQHQGEQYQEELQQLREQENVGPSEEVSRRCLRLIRRELRRRKLRAVGRQAVKVAGKAAVVLLVAVSCLTAAFALSPGFRSSALRWMVGTFGDHTEYRFTDQTDEKTHYRSIQVNWLPEGFELVEDQSVDDYIWRKYVKADASTAQQIDIQVLSFSENGVYLLNTEDAHIYQTSIQGYLATIIERDNTVQITWQYPTGNCMVRIWGKNLNTEVILRIANSVQLS